MKFLLDAQGAQVRRKHREHPGLIRGQLITPLTKYANWDEGEFAVDNGCFKRFDDGKFTRLLHRNKRVLERCLFVVAPDRPGSAMRTLELWKRRWMWVSTDWPIAFVAQDGQEDLEIPWDELNWLFLGGLDPWKDSRAAQDIVKTAVMMDIPVHIGRVNTPERYHRYCELGATTCDGSGASRYDWMLPALRESVEEELPLMKGAIEDD